MRKVIVLPLAVLFLAAGTSATGAEEPAKADKNDPKQWVCKVEKMTGSLTRTRRLCMQREEWTKLAQGSAQDVTKFVRDSTGPGTQKSDAQLASGW